MLAAIARARPQESAVPPVVGAYLRWAGAEQARGITRVVMSHEGRFRTRIDGPWFPITGELQLWPEALQRVWTGVIKPYPLVRLTGRDTYRNGTGQMVIKAYSRFTLSNVVGPEMDLSALVTILAELPMAPHALVPSRRLSWQAESETSARATLRDGRLAVSGVFRFGPDGRLLRFETEDRYRQVGKTSVRTPWVIDYDEFTSLDGCKVPRVVEGAWRLDDCELSYARFEARRIKFER